MQNFLALDLQLASKACCSVVSAGGTAAQALQPIRAADRASLPDRQPLQQQKGSPQAAETTWRLGTVCRQPQTTAPMLVAADGSGKGKCRVAMQ